MPLGNHAGKVVAIRPDLTLVEAAQIMVRDQVGALLIRKNSTSPIEGILTDRDIVKEIADGQDPNKTTASRFAGHRPVETVAANATRREIAKKMRTHGVRRIPLVNERDEVEGIVSMDDLIFEIGGELFDLSRAIGTELLHEEPWPDPDR